MTTPKPKVALDTVLTIPRQGDIRVRVLVHASKVRALASKALESRRMRTTLGNGFVVVEVERGVWVEGIFQRKEGA